MTVTAVARGPETDAVIAAISAALLCGDAVRPDGGGFAGQDTTTAFTPYCVVYQSIVTLIDGPVSDPNADTQAEYQVTSVGVTREQASWAADKARDALLNTALSVAGRHVQLVEWTGGQPASRDDDVVPPLYYVVDLYQVATSPA